MKKLQYHQQRRTSNIKERRPASYGTLDTHTHTHTHAHTITHTNTYAHDAHEITAARQAATFSVRTGKIGDPFVFLGVCLSRVFLEFWVSISKFLYSVKKLC